MGDTGFKGSYATDQSSTESKHSSATECSLHRCYKNAFVIEGGSVEPKKHLSNCMCSKAWLDLFVAP